MLDSLININQDTTPCQEPPEINIELYSEGFFDGVCGLDATLPHFWDYWQGYQLGYREYCCGLLGVAIPRSELEPNRLATLKAIA